MLLRCGVEQRQLVGLITRRSLVRIQSPLPERRPRGRLFFLFQESPPVFVFAAAVYDAPESDLLSNGCPDVLLCKKFS